MEVGLLPVYVIFFILLAITGFLALFFLVVAVLRQSKTMLIIGVAISVALLLLYGFVCWF